MLPTLKIIDPSIKKGRWQPKEEKKLVNLINLFGKSWRIISKIMKNRSAKQIRNRFRNNLDENLKKDYFTKEEDEKLIKFMNDKSANRIFLRDLFPNRSIKMINNRKMLLKNKIIIKNQTEERFIRQKTIDFNNKIGIIYNNSNIYSVIKQKSFIRNKNNFSKSDVSNFKFDDNCKDSNFSSFDNIDNNNDNNLIIDYPKRETSNKKF